MPKMGDIHPESGKVFWCKAKSCLNGEHWVAKEKFAEKMAKKRAHQKLKWDTDPAFKAKKLARASAWNKSPAGRAYDSIRKSRPDELEKRRIRLARFKATNPVSAARSRISSKLYKVVKAKRMSRSYTASKALGIDWPLLEKFIADQFTDGMGWDNKNEWHIDHFIPMKLAKTARQVQTLTHYTNLRPLWAMDNLKKGDTPPTTGELQDRYNFVSQWQRENIAA